MSPLYKTLALIFGIQIKNIPDCKPDTSFRTPVFCFKLSQPCQPDSVVLRIVIFRDIFQQVPKSFVDLKIAINKNFLELQAHEILKPKFPSSLRSEFLICNHLTRRPCWGSIKYTFFSKNLHENIVQFPEERNASFLNHLHGRRGVTCKPAIQAPQKTAFENLSPGAYFRNPFYEFALGESVADVHYKNINRFYCRKMPFVNTGRKCNGDEFQI